MRVYGPYTRTQDKRKFVILYDGKKRSAMSYARYLMQKELGRSLTKDETVDHIDGNVENDKIENLQILSLADNIRKEMLTYVPKFITRYCGFCGIEVKRTKSKFKTRKTGLVFCSKECNGKVNH
jgi:hypothetical protein